MIAFDIAAERIDQTPFEAAAGPAQGKAPIVGLVEAIHKVVTSIDLDAKASVAEFIGVAQPWRDARIESRIDNRELSVHASGDVLGMTAKVRLEYSARDPARTLTSHLEGGRFSSEKLPGGVRPGEVAGTLGGLRGEEEPFQVGVEHQIPGLLRHLERRLADVEPGVVDEDVQSLASNPRRGGDAGGDAVQIAHVQRQRRGLDSGLSQTDGGRFRPLHALRQLSHGDPCPGGGQRLRRCLPDPRAGAGHQRAQP